MTPAEYAAATDHREAESVHVLSRLMPEELARERVLRGTARFLPDGLDTTGYHHQGMGIGTRIIQDLSAEAAGRGQPAT